MNKLDQMKLKPGLGALYAIQPANGSASNVGS